MRPVETIPGMGERVIKENGGGGELKCDIFYVLEELLQMPQYTLTQHKNKYSPK
jgi:hypothetical protein